MEIELKIVLSEENLKRFLQSRFFESKVVSGSAGKLSLVSTYYDTPDLCLRREGVAYRVRSTTFGDGRVEYESTTKRTLQKQGGIAEREEFNGPQEDALPRLAGAVQLFATEVEREVCLLRFGGAVFEMAVDRGRIVAPDGRWEPIDEVEFELKDGGREGKTGQELLRELRAELARVVEFSEESRSKYVRGMKLGCWAE